MAKRNVVWTRTADIQFVEVLEYWVKRNKSTAYSKKLVTLVKERTSQIAEKPFIYKQINFKDIRAASMGNFSIYYKVLDKEIIISAFLG